MALYVRKSNDEMIAQILKKLSSGTPVRSTGPGAVARSLAEAVTTEVADFYNILDFTITQSVVSTAKGSALDKIGSLFNINRRTVDSLTEINRAIGAFYFYIDAPSMSEIIIPVGTRVYTSTTDFIGRQYTFITTEATTIRIGNTRAFASIKPEFTDSVFTAGPGTLVVHSFTSPAGTPVRCTNPKTIAPQAGYEDDSSYRLRIMKQVRIASGGTPDAIRFTALGVPGVRDAKIREAIYGLGSFEVIVTPENTTYGPALLQEVNSRLRIAKPVGSRMIVRHPTLLPTDIYATIVITKRNATADQLLARRAYVAILRYLNTFLPGDTMVYNKLIQEVLDVSELIHDVQITRYAPNGGEVLRKNYVPNEDEQIIPGRVEISIA